jgi:hypothetical protein
VDPAKDLGVQDIENRFRWAREQGHPTYLWPEVAIRDWRSGLKQIERVTAEVLSGSGMPSMKIRDPGPGALTVAAFTSGVGPLLGYWIESGALSAGSRVGSLMRLHLEHGRRRAARLEWELRRAVGLLAGAGVDCIVLKGAHTSRAYFPEPGTRPAADLDLAIDPKAIPAATNALREAGYRGMLEQRRPYKADWRPPDAPQSIRSLYFNHPQNPFAIELHGSMDRDFCGVRSVKLVDGVEGTEPWPELHSGTRVLAQPQLTAYLAAHASEGLQNLTLVRLVELVFVVRRDAGRTLDWKDFLELLSAKAATGYVYPALALVEQLAPGTIDETVLRSVAAAAPRRVRALIERVTPATAYRPERISLEERFMWAVGPLDYARRAARTVWPIAGGGSFRRLARIYRDRVYEVARGVVSIRALASETGENA